MTEPPDSPENPHAGQGSVMLDIGGDVGALIVVMPLAMVGHEVDIAAAGHEQDHLVHAHDADDEVGHGHGHGHGHGAGHREHVAVVRRPTPSGRVIPTLVYPCLTQGRYSLLLKGTDDVVMWAEVLGGQATETTWPS